MKPGLLIILFVCLLFLCACGGNLNLQDASMISDAVTPTTVTTEPITRAPRTLDGIKYNRGEIGTYSVEKQTVSHSSDIYFSYPQLTGFNDTIGQEKVNEFIYEFPYILKQAVAAADDESINEFILDYRIMLFSPELISIVFEGKERWDGSSRNKFAKGFTFDLNTMRVLDLDEFVVLDESFAAKLLASERVFGSFDPAEHSLDPNILRDEFRESWSIERIMDWLSTLHDFFYSEIFYVTQTSVSVRFSVSPAYGDYVWVEIPLEG